MAIQRKLRLGFAESYKVTEAGIEKLAFAHNDAMLILDDLSRSRGTPKEKVERLEGLVNDYCAGTAMTRAIDKHGGLHWSGLVLVTSNESYSELLEKAGQVAAPAMGPRLIELQTDLGTGYGIFDSLPPRFSSSQAAVQAMDAAINEAYGVAAPAFARRLIKAQEDDPARLEHKLDFYGGYVFEMGWEGPQLC